MTTVATQRAPGRTLLSRIATSDHRDLACLYFLLALAAVVIGTLLSLAIRIHRVWPTYAFPGYGIPKPEDYLALVTMHGTLMVFFVLTVVPQAAFPNLVLPAQIGAERMAFPRCNAAAFWITLASLLTLLAAFFVPQGAPISGWTSYPPFSALPAAGPGQGNGMDLWLLSILLFCLASLLASFNFLVTIFARRAPGMTFTRLPLTVWSWLASSGLTVIAFSALLAAAAMLLADRLASSILANFTRRPVLAYRFMVACTLFIGVFGLGVWGHHIFVSGMNPYAGTAFGLTTIAIAVPSSAEVLAWLAMLFRGPIRLKTPMLFTLGFISFFIAGGLTGPLLAQPALDAYLHNTFFVVAHFHLVMAMAGIFSIFAGLYYWFPLLTGRRMNETLGQLHFWISVVAAYGTFFPMHFAGLAGEPRHYAQLSGTVESFSSLIPVERGITFAALTLAGAQLLFLFNIFWSMRRGLPAGENPWAATTLEWSPIQPHFNIIRDPYLYGTDIATGTDFLPQWQSLPEAGTSAQPSASNSE
jgi:cytochrome c oxidase subunit 1